LPDLAAAGFFAAFFVVLFFFAGFAMPRNLLHARTVVNEGGTAPGERHSRRDAAPM
jgi:hypothetical protein